MRVRAAWTIITVAGFVIAGVCFTAAFFHGLSAVATGNAAEGATAWRCFWTGGGVATASFASMSYLVGDA